MPQESELRELFKLKNVNFDIFEMLYSIVCSACSNIHFFIEGERVIFRSSTGFLYVWFSNAADEASRTSPLVVSILSPQRLDSDRFSLVVPCQKGYMHHISITSVDEFDEQFIGWIKDASAFSRYALAY
jgi:hypothetical protein